MAPTDRDTMQRLYRSADIFFALRDSFAEEGSHKGRPREAGFRTIAQYAAENHERLDLARQFLETEVQSPNLGNFEIEDLKETVIRKKPLEQMYMVCRILDVTDDSSDTRTRDLMKMISRSPHALPIGCYLIPFLRSFTAVVKSQSDMFFRTVRSPTRFGILLYLSNLLYIMREKESRRQNKKRRLTTGAAPGIFLEGFPNFSKETCQRTGFAVEMTIYAWDIFARGLGFDDVESMIYPYIMFDTNNMMFKVLDNRSIGYCPLSHHTRLEENVEPTMKRGGVVAAFSDDVDSNLRILAKEFLDDVHGMCTHERLYTLQGQNKHERWVTLEQLTPDMDRKARDPSHTRDEQFPERFDRLAEDLWKPILDATGCARAEASNADVEMVQAPVNLVSSDEDDFEPAPVPIRSKFDTPDRTVEPPKVAKGRFLPNAMKQLNELMRTSYSVLYNCNQKDLVVTHESLGMESTLTLGDAQLVLTDPPFNTRRRQGKSNSDHDVLTEKDMERAAGTLNDVLRPGGHFIIFCAVEQFLKWFEIMNDTVRKKRVAVVRNGKRVNEERFKPIFRVDKTLIVFIREPGNHNQNPTRVSSLMSVTEYAIHGVKRGLTSEEERSMVSLESFHYVPSTVEPYKNVVNNVPKRSKGELLTWRVKKKDGWKTQIIRPEQKSRELMKELISRFTKPGDKVVDPFAGTCTTGMACLSLPKHRKFIGCELDGACFEHATHHMTLHLARVINDGTTDISVDQSTLQSASRVVEAYPLTTRVSKAWRPPGKFPQYQRLPLHILIFLQNLWLDKSFFHLACNKAVGDWPEKYRGALDRVDSRSLLAQDASCSSVTVAKSTIKHPKAGLGVFATTAFKENDVICHFYGTLVYHNLSSRDETHTTYGKGMLGVTAERFRKYCIETELEGDVFLILTGNSGGDRKKPVVWVVPAPFCAAGYINDARYVEGDPEKDGPVPPGGWRDNNASFERTKRGTTSLRNLEAPQLLSIIAARDIEEGEEIFMDYGRPYDWAKQLSS